MVVVFDGCACVLVQVMNLIDSTQSMRLNKDKGGAGDKGGAEDVGED